MNAAGIDISPKKLQVCVPSDRDEKCNRTFGVYTKDLHEISKWLKECGIDSVVMESTGIYWLPLFRVLKDDGFEVMLVNPKDAKNYAGKKTDEADAHWLMVLHTYAFILFTMYYLMAKMYAIIKFRAYTENMKEAYWGNMIYWDKS